MSTVTEKSVERTTVPVEKFVEVWETSDSIKEVCEKLNMKYNAVIARANGLRNARKDVNGNVTRAGVNLKQMPRGGRKTKINPNDLNTLIERLRAAQATKTENQAEPVKNNNENEIRVDETEE